MIHLNNIFKTFSTSQVTPVKALSNITLTIAAQEFVVVIGSNGSGKSTLLNSIAGSFLVDDGAIEIDGNDVTKLPDYKRAKWLSRVFQNPLQGTAPDLSILDNFRLAALRTKSKSLIIGNNQKFKLQVQNKLATLNMDLENKLQTNMGSLSGGQRQALTLLMATMDDSKILLLDEPTAALDPKSAEIVMLTANNLIKDLQLTAMLVTHNIADAVVYGNRLIQMQQGNIIKDVAEDEKQKLTEQEIISWF